MSDVPKILAVDDRRENLRALAVTLADAGADLIEATSGNEALTASLERDFALAIVDVRMPEMDGYELAEILRGDERTKSLPIIFVTAELPDEPSVFRGYEAGAVDYLIKPYAPQVLLGKVRVFLELDRQRAELLRQRERLEDVVDELGRSRLELEQYAHVASHDMKEPLRMVALHMQMLARDYGAALDERARGFIDSAVAGALRLGKLIDDFVALTRVSGTATDFREVACAPLVQEVLADLSQQIGRSGAEVTVQALPTVFGDHTLLRIAFRELLDNAVKFHGGEAPRVEVSAAQEDRSWVFCVRDNGIGIDPDFQDRIFTLCQRLHPPHRYEGAGVGLTIARKIVERHGGRLWVDSEPERGAAFYFTLEAR